MASDLITGLAILACSTVLGAGVVMFGGSLFQPLTNNATATTNQTQAEPWPLRLDCLQYQNGTVHCTSQDPNLYFKPDKGPTIQMPRP